MKPRTALLTAALLLLALPALHAQAAEREGGFFARRLQVLTQRLDLTPEQAANARRLFESQRAQLQPMREQRRQNREQLKAALDAPNPDPAEVGRLVISAHEAREQARAARQELDRSFSALLTPEQRAKYDALKERRGHARHGWHGRHEGRGRR